jgi:predicted transposase YdaD
MRYQWKIYRRKLWKMRLVRQIYESGYNEEQVVNLFKFLDWVLALPKSLDDEFWTELKAYEEERQMPYITSVERIGYERGQKEGRAEGRVEERRSLISFLLQQKIGAVPQALNDRLSPLSPDQLEELAIALLNFNTAEDLNQWFNTHI